MCMIHLPSAQYNDLCGALMKPTRLQKILKVLAQSTETSFYKLLFIMVRTLLIKQAQLRHTLGDQTLLWVLYHRCQMQVPQRTSPAPAHLARGLVSSSVCVSGLLGSQQVVWESGMTWGGGFCGDSRQVKTRDKNVLRGQHLVKMQQQPSLGGLEPPTFRLTAERADRLRHRDSDVESFLFQRNYFTVLFVYLNRVF